MRYLTANELAAMNQRIINLAGAGTFGIADANGLDAIAKQPSAAFFGREAYPTLWLKAAFMLQKITKKHVFFDGNKRTAYMATVYFLDMNGYSLVISEQDGQDLMLTTTIEPDTEAQMIKVARFLKRHAHPK